MAYHNYTTMCGNLEDGTFKWVTGSGHWKPEAALRKARRCKIYGPVTISHEVIDQSGKGRGGHDGKWRGDETGLIKIENWQEGGHINK